MFGLGIQELLIILVLVLIFFGAEKIPQLAKSLGKGVSEFRKAQGGLRDEMARGANGGAGMREEAAGTASAPPCPSCAEGKAAGGVYCSRCGRRLDQEDYCASCGRTLRAEDRFCANCGQAR